jgi:hypothetical protein
MLIKARSSVVVACVGLACLGVACGGSPGTKQGAKAADKSDDVLRPITQAQLDVAHYATGDGRIGFVLDRTKEPARFRMDGQKDVVELTPVEERDARGRQGTTYKAPDGKNVLFISVDGGIKLYGERDAFWVNSDKKAGPLGSATVTGKWTETKTKREIYAEQLAARSVVSKTGLKEEDASKLTKVEQAVASAPKESFVRFTKAGAAEAQWMPVSNHGYSGTGSGETWDKAKATGYAKYGGHLVGHMVRFGSPNRLHTETLRGWDRTPAPGTPALVWNVDGSYVTLVTLDGGRYYLWLPTEDTAMLEDGVGSAASWPAPLAQSVLSVADVHEMGKIGAVPEGTPKEIDALDDGWFECFNEQWKTAQKSIDAVERSQIAANEKYGKTSGIYRSAELDAPKKCAPAKKALEDGLVRIIEARNRERAAIFEKAKTRFR